MGKTHCVVPDPHATPEASNERFLALGNFILDRRPDVVICLGDFADFGSLSSYDKGKKDFEGRRIARDIDAANEALELISRPIDAYNEQCRRNKKAIYKPRKIMLGGNHDQGRLERLVQLHPELDGVIGLHQIQFVEHGWEYIPYRMPIEVDGIYYCHHFPTGVSGEPISGVNLAGSLIAKNMISSTVGHSHILDMSNRTRPDGKRIWGLSAGCFVDYEMKYAFDTQPRFWWSGIVMKNDVDDGDYDAEFISMRKLKREYL